MALISFFLMPQRPSKSIFTTTSIFPEMSVSHGGRFGYGLYKHVNTNTSNTNLKGIPNTNMWSDIYTVIIIRAIKLIEKSEYYKKFGTKCLACECVIV